MLIYIMPYTCFKKKEIMAYALYLTSTPPNSSPSIGENYNNPSKACLNLPQNGFMGNLKVELISSTKRATFVSRAKRRVRYEDDDDEEDEDSGYNEEIAKLEMYSQSAREEALFVTTLVDDQQVQLLIFKGFSSCLSHETAADPTKSIVPKRAKIKFIDRIRAPFNPANTEYIEKGMTWDAFQNRLLLTN